MFSICFTPVVTWNLTFYFQSLLNRNTNLWSLVFHASITEEVALMCVPHEEDTSKFSLLQLS